MIEQQSSAQISFLKMYYEYVVKCKTADIPENEKDVWDMRSWILCQGVIRFVEDID